jgi:predicted RNase H-like HicB family nuclease
MIKKSTILKTAVCWWSEEDEAYIVQSPLFLSCLVDGETEEEARATYSDALEQMYESLVHNKVAGHDSKGRPAKNGVKTFVELRQQSKIDLAWFAQDLGISQGEVIDWALFCLSHNSKNPGLNPGKLKPAGTLVKRVEDIEKRLQVFESQREYNAVNKMASGD